MQSRSRLDHDFGNYKSTGRVTKITLLRDLSMLFMISIIPIQLQIQSIHQDIHMYMQTNVITNAC